MRETGSWLFLSHCPAEPIKMLKDFTYRTTVSMLMSSHTATNLHLFIPISATPFRLFWMFHSTQCMWCAWRCVHSLIFLLMRIIFGEIFICQSEVKISFLLRKNFVKENAIFGLIDSQGFSVWVSKTIVEQTLKWTHQRLFSEESAAWMCACVNVNLCYNIGLFYLYS